MQIFFLRYFTKYEDQKFYMFYPISIALLLLLLLPSRFNRVRLYVTATDSSPPGSPVPGILQARILEWVAISFSSA